METIVGMGSCSQRPPPVLWGLDPLFRNFVKIYVSEIKDLKQSDTYPGVFWYKDHPLTKVDIMGIVVKVEHKYKFSLYSVDDGSGVINCLLWNKLENTTQPQLTDLPPILQEKLVSSEESSTYTLGAVLHVRGRVKQYQDNRDVVAMYCREVHDVYEEVYRMLEMPDLYTRVYDRPCELVERLTGQDSHAITQATLSSAFDKLLLAHLHHRRREDVISTDVLKDEDLKSKLIEEFADHTDDIDNLWTTIVEESVKHLQELGFLYPSSNSAYKFVPLCKELHEATISVLKSECAKEEFSENGCHYWHILREMKKSLKFSQLGKEAMLKVLDQLEGQSDVISTTSQHYIVFDV